MKHDTPAEQPGFSFCETSTAIRWHIRELETGEQKLLGGGLRKKTLCGLPASWDIRGEFNETTLADACRGCVEIYLNLKA